jgi:hypothetical protein
MEIPTKHLSHQRVIPLTIPHVLHTSQMSRYKYPLKQLKRDMDLFLYRRVQSETFAQSR